MKGFIGVIDGKPAEESCSDECGDCKFFTVYKTEAEALERWFNVRRVQLVVDAEPVRAPEDWGQINE